MARVDPERWFRNVRRIARRFEPRVRRAFLRGLDRLRRRIDLAELRRAIAAGSDTLVEAAIAPDELALLLGASGYEDELVSAVRAAGASTARIVSGAVGLEFAFDEIDPVSVLWARSASATRVVAVADDVREAIRIIGATAQRFGLTVDQHARALFEVVGLPPNWTNAPANFAEEIRTGRVDYSRKLSAIDRARIRKRIADGTVDEAFVADMERTYAERLRRVRSRTIARTETMGAANFGQRTAWVQARREEVLPATARRVWIVTPDDRLRPTHAAVPGMNPDGVEIDGGVYETPVGPSGGPPLEPNCRCSEGLVFPGLSS